MSRVSAADNLIIEMEGTRWRLLANGVDAAHSAQTLLEVTEGGLLRYAAAFGTARRLPESGSIAASDVQRVVVGWSKEDRCWHLGLLFEPEFARQRGGRWCELALWYDPRANVYSEGAANAGRALAAALGRSFTLVPPKQEDVAPQIAPQPTAGDSVPDEDVQTHEFPPVRKPRTIEMPALPIRLNRWTLTNSAENESQLALMRARGWATGRALRVVWYGLLTVIYLVLATFTLRGDIALPNAGTMLPEPRILPYLGLITAAILVVLIFVIITQLLRSPRQFTFLSAAQSPEGQPTVAATVNGSQLWQQVGVRGVYVTEVARVRRDKRGERERLQYTEINLLLDDERFRRLIYDDTPDDQERPMDYHGEDVIVPLTAENVQDEVQAAGVYIADALGVPCYYDRRVK